MTSKCLLIFLIVLIAFSCNQQKGKENTISVFCASSLAPVVSEIKETWEKDHPDRVIINAASSGVLARQIEHGAQADIFISANSYWMDYLLEVHNSNISPIVIASNKLAVVTSLDMSIDSMAFQDQIQTILKMDTKIAVGDPTHVPLGKYTREMLEYYGIYQQLSPQFIPTKDARSVLRLVELGEAGLGFVFLTDALKSDKVRIIGMAPEQSHQKMVYQAVLLSSGKAVTDFYQFIQSEMVNAIWIKHGFIREM
jgi:molybdate transport system substrate-binding protein